MFLIGAGFRLAWEYRRRNRTSEWARIGFALLLPFTVIVLRGNFQDSGTRALFVVVPVPVVPPLVALRGAGTQTRPRTVAELPAEEVPHSG